MNSDIILMMLVAILAAYSVVLTAMFLKQRQGNKATQSTSVASGTASQSPDDASEETRFIQRADEAQRLISTFQKFVPRQFVDHFAKHGEGSLELGHADEDEIAILFCDIRGFTGLSEKMTPQELMKFLNSYFLRMNDPIHQNGGFIDKFIGDAIMALFDHPNGTNEDKARDAIRASIDLRKTLALYNQHRANVGYPPVNIGIGVHFGPAVLGTVGSDDRMDTTVLGDSVNISYRLEALAPIYQADIVVSANLLEAANGHEFCQTRILDWVRVKGRTQPVEIYEVLDHLSEDEQDKRLASAPFIEEGLRLRKQKNWTGALEQFNNALDINKDDFLVQYHISQCAHLQESELPADWDGAHLNR